MDSLSDVKVSYLTDFHRDGVCVFNNLITTKQIQTIKTAVQHINAIVLAKVNTQKRPLRVYSDIAERELGRLDYRCGFTADIFEEVGDQIHRIIQLLSPQIDFRQNWGALPALNGAGPSAWHRDVYPLLNTSLDNDLNKLDVNLPPYYFTVLIPLQQITPENGPTQFIKGSHLHAVVDESNADIYAPQPSAGDIVILDGRIVHRGLANQSAEQRLIAYITYVANWYHDQTFTINDYLFPELSTRGI